MISDSCSSFLQGNDLESFITDLRYFLNDKTYSKYYSGDIRIRCEWMVIDYDSYVNYPNREPNENIYMIRQQAKLVLDTLQKVPHLEKVSEVYDNWKF